MYFDIGFDTPGWVCQNLQATLVARFGVDCTTVFNLRLWILKVRVLGASLTIWYNLEAVTFHFETLRLT